MSDYSYPAELIKKTEKRIRVQLDGNDHDISDVSFAIQNQGQGTLSASTSFQLDCNVKTAHHKGKTIQGIVVESGQGHAEIQSFTQGLNDNESLNEIALNLIKSMPLKGFGADKQKIDLRDHQQHLTEHTNCGRCRGQGQSQCQYCRGQGYTDCNLCHGRGVMTCLHCQGRRQIQNGNQMQPCTHCQGRGEVYCTQCNGQRQMPCGQCQARGITSCADCNGQGVNSTIITMTPSITAHGEIHLGDLDGDVKNMVAKIGAYPLAQKGHITPKTCPPPVQEEVERAYYEDEPVDMNKNKVFYTVDIPWAVMDVTLNGKTYDLHLVGTKGAVAASKNFMDDILQKPISLFRGAAKGDGFVAGMLKDACTYRVSRETLTALAQSNPKKAMHSIHKNYRTGLSKQTIQNFVKNGYLAMKRVTRRPRYIGMSIALMLSAAINYFCFMGDVDKGFLPPLPTPQSYIYEAIPLVLGIILTVICIKGTAFFVFQSLMKDIGIKTRKFPAMGKAGLYGLLGTIALWGLFFANQVL